MPGKDFDFRIQRAIEEAAQDSDLELPDVDTNTFNKKNKGNGVVDSVKTKQAQQISDMVARFEHLKLTPVQAVKALAVSHAKEKVLPRDVRYRRVPRVYPITTEAIMEFLEGFPVELKKYRTLIDEILGTNKPMKRDEEYLE